MTTTQDRAGNLHRGAGSPEGGQFAGKRNARPRPLSPSQRDALANTGGMFKARIDEAGDVVFVTPEGDILPIHVTAGWSSSTPGLPVLYVDTMGLPEDDDGPILRVSVNDEPVYQPTGIDASADFDPEDPSTFDGLEPAVDSQQLEHASRHWEPGQLHMAGGYDDQAVSDWHSGDGTLIGHEVQYSRLGRYHREDGPAIERYVKAGSEPAEAYWYRNGERHRIDGPAVTNAMGRNWFVNGRLHRTDGPAIENRDGSTAYFLNGKLVEKEDVMGPHA